MAEHSGIPLAAKLGIRPGVVVALLHLPDDLVLDLPADVTVRRRAAGRADVAVDFVTRAPELERRIDRLGALIHPAGALWIAWPKRASGVATDMTDHVVRDLALPRGLVDNKVCALDDTWTGLRVVWRVANR
ncbi:MAG TPA: DUF3052 domain-containing protein [Acidimicrobiales bacterium]